MTKQIAQIEVKDGRLTEENMKVLARAGIIPPKTPMDQVIVFGQICAEKGLSPFSKEIYLVSYFDKRTNANKYSVITGIDGFRKIACRSGEYAGCDAPKFNKSSDGNYLTSSDLISKKQKPISCEVTVYRIIQGQKVAFTKPVIFGEFNTGKQKWGTMPFQMIQKVAEAFSLRSGFADQLTGLHIAEEKGAFEDDQIKPEVDQIEKQKILDDISILVDSAETNEELVKLYNDNPNWHNTPEIIEIFTTRKNKIEG